jgi:lipopolysaccharide/colanic/teichoic acid biosynthesis glycosyltransferase
MLTARTDIESISSDHALSTGAGSLGSVSAMYRGGSAPNSAESSIYVHGGKRLFDLIAASVLLVLALPVMAVVALLVALDGGKPIFGHTRMGKAGVPFRCFKFRTMVVDADERLRRHLADNPAAAEEWARDFKLRDDPRITPLGRFLRKSSLDELPQLVNVMRGEMSLVGPRPVTKAEIDLYGADAAAYFAVRPGITGIWQISGRNSVSYETRIQMDRSYTQSISLGQDLRILVKTMFAVLWVTGC